MAAVLQVIGSVCWTNRCSKLVFTDITGVTSLANPTGWEGGNLSGADVTIATLIITYPDGTTDVVDVSSAFGLAVTGEFSFDPIDPVTSFPDGYYEITYFVSNAGGTITSTVTVAAYNYCSALCELDCLWADLRTEMCENPCGYTDYMNELLEAEAILTALKYAEACGGCKEGADQLMETLIAITDGRCNCG